MAERVMGEPANLAAARAGHLDAFEALMRQHERLVLVTALRLETTITEQIVIRKAKA